MPISVTSADYQKALEIGRPPNICQLFPNSKALIVSGKVIDRAMLKKGGAMTIAANGRSLPVIQGSLLAAQRANAAVIIEIAKSESNYCLTNMWNLARRVDALMNQLGITVPVAVHADHYGIKNEADFEQAKVEIPTLFDAGITSIAVDASHMPDDENLIKSVALNPLIPSWAGLETEVGEIKGQSGLSTPAEALFLIQGLNANGISPDWIALNNGTAHGIQTEAEGISVELTAKIHKALEPYAVSGAQHGTSGNDDERLCQIAARTKTTKANVATALQMIAWGVKVNAYGNAEMDAGGDFIKLEGQGITEELWAEMKAYADANGIKGGDYKKLNLPFENKTLAMPKEIRERSVKAVDEFVYHLLTEVFNAGDTAPLGIEAILEADSFDLGPKAQRTEDPADWTEEKLRARAAAMDVDKGEEGDFDD
jgi:fructose-bisphosphate aldolase class II